MGKVLIGRTCFLAASCMDATFSTQNFPVSTQESPGASKISGTLLPQKSTHPLEVNAGESSPDMYFDSTSSSEMSSTLWYSITSGHVLLVV